MTVVFRLSMLQDQFLFISSHWQTYISLQLLKCAPYHVSSVDMNMSVPCARIGVLWSRTWWWEQCPIAIKVSKCLTLHLYMLFSWTSDSLQTGTLSRESVERQAILKLFSKMLSTLYGGVKSNIVNLECTSVQVCISASINI